MTRFRLRDRAGGLVVLQISHQDMWFSILKFTNEGKIIRVWGLPEDIGLQLDDIGRLAL